MLTHATLFFGETMQYFFSGGTMPSDELFLYFQDDVKLEKHWVVNGKHYGRTCQHWLDKMYKHEGAVRKIFTLTYGAADQDKWFAMWKLFFMSCRELFNYDNGNQWVVSHYLFRTRATK
jgi:cyclopropane-fatty-acyl-phospholipid synthase